MQLTFDSDVEEFRAEFSAFLDGTEKPKPDRPVIRVVAGDLGTEFGVEVTPEQESRLQVFQGKIVVLTFGLRDARSAMLRSQSLIRS